MVKSRRSEYAEETRQAILASARDAFATTGYANSSLDDIAAAARVTKGALYHHFGSKLLLFEAVFIDVEQAMMAEAGARAAAHLSDPWQALTASTDAFLDACTDGVYRRIVLEDGPAVLGSARWSELEENIAIGQMESMLRAYQAMGLVVDGDPHLLSRLFLGTLMQAGFAIGAADDPAATRAAVAPLVARIFEAFRAPGR
jgi:AcrR family transcriptional regulator